MKKIRITRLNVLLLVLGLLIYISASILYDLYFPKDEKPIASTVSVTDETPDQADVEELQFTDQEKAGYYESYKSPYVIAIRKALDSYLSGKDDYLEDLAIESSKDEDAAVSGLDSFDKSYYKSKFIVYYKNRAIVGGQTIQIIFVDKPDKLFVAWVYDIGDVGNYTLRTFYENIKFTPDKMLEIRKQYRSFFSDTEHMM